MFGDVEFQLDRVYSDTVPLEAQLEALGEAVRSGKQEGRAQHAFAQGL